MTLGQRIVEDWLNSLMYRGWHGFDDKEEAPKLAQRIDTALAEKGRAERDRCAKIAEAQPGAVLLRTSPGGNLGHPAEGDEGRSKLFRCGRNRRRSGILVAAFLGVLGLADSSVAGAWSKSLPTRTAAETTVDPFGAAFSGELKDGDGATAFRRFVDAHKDQCAKSVCDRAEWRDRKNTLPIDRRVARPHAQLRCEVTATGRTLDRFDANARARDGRSFHDEEAGHAVSRQAIAIDANVRYVHDRRVKRVSDGRMFARKLGQLLLQGSVDPWKPFTVASSHAKRVRSVPRDVERHVWQGDTCYATDCKGGTVIQEAYLAHAVHDSRADVGGDCAVRADEHFLRCAYDVNNRRASGLRAKDKQRGRRCRDQPGVATWKWIRRRPTGMGWGWNEGPGAYVDWIEAYDVDVSVDLRCWFHLTGSTCFDRLPPARPSGSEGSL